MGAVGVERVVARGHAGEGSLRRRPRRRQGEQAAELRRLAVVGPRLLGRRSGRSARPSPGPGCHVLPPRGPLRGGAAGGGTRMRKGLDKREVESLAKTMEIKFTVAGPPIGGAKSGINFDPKDLSLF